MASLNNLQDLRTVLGRLNAERPAGSGGREGETEHQERGGELLRRLKLEVESRQGKARVLITGQIGVGKSSELWHFYRQSGEGNKRRVGFWVHCDLEKEEHPERCGATGVFLTMFRDCWGATRNFRTQMRKSQSKERSFLQTRNHILEQLIDWLKGERSEDGQRAVFCFGGMDFPVFLKDKDSALHLILGKACQHEAVSDRSEGFGSVPPGLINLLNKLLRVITEACFGRPPVIIMDHVDKIRDASSAREVLIEVVPQWNRIEASIVMTAPFEYTLGAMRNSVESYWGKPLMVYPVEIPELGTAQSPPIYAEIVKSCGLTKMIRMESLNLLAHYSGGILRAFVQFLIQAAKEAHLAGHRQIELADAQAVVHNAENAYQDYGLKEMGLLDQLEETKIGLGDVPTLLRSPIGILVMESEGGEQQLRAHPLAEKLLERYRFDMKRATG